MWFQNRPRPRTSPRHDRFRPRVEPLDGRCLPSITLSGTYPAGATAYDVSTADVNGDGALDLVVADLGSFTPGGSSGGVSVLLGKKNRKGQAAGTFGAATEYAVGSVAGVAVGDLNADGKPDIVASNGSVLLNDGNGTFRAGPSCPGGTLADVDGDGKLDLVHVSSSPTSTVGIYLGNGDGTFRAGSTYPIPAPRALAVGDFNRDGMADLLIATDADDTVKLMPATGGGNFAAAQTVASFANPPLGGYVDLTALTVADFNADGKPDFAVAYSITEDGFVDFPPTDSFAVRLGDGTGGFADGGFGQFDTIYYDPVRMATGDFNHDGKLDLVGIGQGNFGIGTVNFGNGDGTFGASQEVPNATYSSGHNPTAVAVGDFNGDGYSDLTVSWWDANSGPSGVDVLDFGPDASGNKHK